MSGILALSTAATVALIGGIIVVLAFIGGLVYMGLRRGPQRGPDIPPGMRPGPSDEILERRNLEKFMAWGVLFTLIFALNVALVWLFEPSTNVSDEIELVNRSVQRGKMWFELTSEENPTGFGCERCHGPEGQGGVVTPYTNPDTGETIMWQEPALNDVCSRLAIEGEGGIRETIMQGRPNTPMPSWSVRFAGAMNDQQIQDLINYIVQLNEKTIGTGEDNLCLNPPSTTGEPGGATPSPTAGATPGATPTGGGTPSPEETSP